MAYTITVKGYQLKCDTAEEVLQILSRLTPTAKPARTPAEPLASVKDMSTSDVVYHFVDTKAAGDTFTVKDLQKFSAERGRKNLNLQEARQQLLGLVRADVIHQINQGGPGVAAVYKKVDGCK